MSDVDYLLNTRIAAVRSLYGSAANPPARAHSIEQLEQRIVRLLPDDARTLLAAFNGSSAPSSVDKGWITLWPAEEWIVPKDIAGDYPSLSHALVIADYGLNSWWYAIDLAIGATTVGPVFGLITEEPIIIAPTLSDFLQRILNNDIALYGGEA